MALYTKQDFNPPILSRKWITMKVRPNMLLYARQHIISILESGLLFREDSVEVEQEAVLDNSERPWLTSGERTIGAATIGAAVGLFPPRRLSRTTILQVAAYLALPLAVRALHRRLCRGTLHVLLQRMRDYLALARRAAACLKECAAFRAQLVSVSSVLQSMHTLLCRQQSSLGVTLARASSALLGNAPWLRADLDWDAVPQSHDDNLLRIHHAFLVVQSSLLKHIAMAHYMPPTQARRLYLNHNERIYWIHTVLISHLADEFAQNYEALERMYRLLKNYGNSDINVSKKPGTAIKDSWLYNDVHGSIARANLELKLALTKCNELDLFLDSCALNKQDLDLDILNKDIDDLIDHITKCLNTTQNSQLRLKKLKNKFGESKEKVEELERVELSQDEAILKIDDREPEVRDEVFYFIKTEDERAVQSSGDVTTAPGRKEKENTKIVLNELRRKLLRREDVMRERERQALAKSMPDTKIPEFPRQINIQEFGEKRGFIMKLRRTIPKKRLFHDYKIKPVKSIETVKKLKNLKKKRRQLDDNLIENKASSSTLYETNSNLSQRSKLLTFERYSDTTVVTEWYKNEFKRQDFDSSGLSEGLSDVETSALNKNVNHAVNFEARLPGKASKTNNQGDKDSNQAGSGNQDAKSSNRNSRNSNQDERNSNQGVKNNNLEQKASRHEARNYRFSKRDLEMTSSSETESDFEAYKEQQVAILKDIRRHRAARKKNHPDRRAIQSPPSTMDEGLRPMEYSLGTGLAMASVMQVNGSGALGLRAGVEEQFIGDGEVSLDSGHDD